MEDLKYFGVQEICYLFIFSPFQAQLLINLGVIESASCRQKKNLFQNTITTVE